MVWGSIKDAAKNIGGAFNAGLKTGLGDFAGAGSSMLPNIGSVGGLATIGGLSVAGAGAGSYYGSISNTSPTIADGAVAGAAVGAAALPAAGLAVAAGWGVVNNLDKIGEAAFATARGASWLGKGALRASNFTGPFAGGNAASRFANTVSSNFMNPVGSIANKFAKASKGLITHTPRAQSWNAEKGIMESKGGGMKLSTWGKAAVAGVGLYSGVMKAMDTFEQSRMGMMDSFVATNTPQIPSYKDDAGATGDLVFALNANRRG